MPADAFCSNEYVEEMGRLEGVKDNMTGGGQPVELAVELLRWVGRAAVGRVAAVVGRSLLMKWMTLSRPAAAN